MVIIMDNTYLQSKNGRPLIFGEVLFDVFPDQSVLGGAPFNAAWHLKGFGLDPLMLSRIGDDSHGKEILAAMESWGMDLSGIQIDKNKDSGKVEISITNKEHSFKILEDQAYDYIQFNEKLLSEDISLIYHGSLIKRSEISSATLNEYIHKSNKPVFIDINLRKPFWEENQIKEMMKTARWIKLNEDELSILYPSKSNLIEQAKLLMSHYNLELLIVTKGSDGAFVLSNEIENSLIEEEPIVVKNLKDTVGAGDAFSSVVLLGLHLGWSYSQCLNRALSFSAHICTIRGAISKDRKLYSDFLNQWS